jgi:hypothetical protein
MHRIAKRIVSLSASALFVGVCLAACASEEPTYDAKAFQEGSCTPEFCPKIAGGRECCLAGPTGSMCGIDFGMGCTPAAVKDGG